MEDSVSYELMQRQAEQVLKSGMPEPVEKIEDGAAPVALPTRGGDATEDLLNGLIAECHHAMRDVAILSAKRIEEAYERQRFLTAAMEIATTGARIGEAIAKLRSSSAVVETRQRQVFEQVERVSPQAC